METSEVMMVHRLWVYLVAGAVLAAATAATAGPREELARYFQDVETLEGTFEQVVRDEDGSVVERSSGTMALHRPDRFDWRYQTPFEQRIVADGEDLWIHDKELRQVTVRPLEEGLAGGPALLLSGELDSVEEAFRIEVDGDWLTLTPRGEAWDVNGIRLRMDGGVPREVVVNDGLGRENRLHLRDVRTNTPLDDARFRFRPDDDTDVIRQGGSAQ